MRSPKGAEGIHQHRRVLQSSERTYKKRKVSPWTEKVSHSAGAGPLVNTHPRPTPRTVDSVQSQTGSHF